MKSNCNLDLVWMDQHCEWKAVNLTNLTNEQEERGLDSLFVWETYLRVFSLNVSLKDMLKSHDLHQISVESSARGQVAVLCVQGFKGFVSRVVEQLCICPSWLRTTNICMLCCIVRCETSDSVNQPDLANQHFSPSFLYLSHCLSFSPPSAIYSPRCCLENYLLLALLAEKEHGVTGHTEGETEGGERATDCSYCLRVRPVASWGIIGTWGG